jgi:(1->4)-alpha-D-glucan 1-alpha-D-glucosylmutase
MTPRATYRLQLTKDFDFDRAADLAEYLRDLGVSHLYASPWLMARAGSSHGYDVINHGELNPELGGEAGFARLSDALQSHQLGHLVDFIPNHIGVGGADNLWWLDVLEWGPDSAYADWFDIDWDPGPASRRNKLLVPFLGNQYGTELENGQLKLVFDEERGSFAVWAYESHKLPICPIHYGRIWREEHKDLERLGDAFGHLPTRYKDTGAAAKLKAELASLVCANRLVKNVIHRCVRRFTGTPGRWDTWKNLNELIQLQHWRPAFFRVASDDINYRRFFNINELAGIRMENMAVFRHTHRLVFDLMKAGAVDGIRVDHVDGLQNPKEYLERLRSSVDAIPGESRRYIVVEKILAPHEGLREDWPIDGTTGYEFAAQVLGVLIDPAGEEELTRAYAEFTGQGTDFSQILRTSKLQIIENEMAGELHGLAREAAAIARSNPHTTDFTENVLRRALSEIVACFPVYRTYVDHIGEPSPEDRRDLQWALERARVQEMEVDPSVFDFLAHLLSGELPPKRGGFSRTEILRFAAKFQQYTTPVMAKGLEDTALFRYNRLLALNEVGARPDQFGLSLTAFHKANANRQKRWPNSMLGTSTHDTKFGEDARARLAVLSELPSEWERQIRAWTRILRAGIGGGEGAAPPDRNDEYFFYQLLIGTWPPELTLPNEIDTAMLAEYAQRVAAAMIKAIREAKTQTSWIAPNAAYENAVTSFVERALDANRSQAFLSQYRPFQERVARLGVQNSLVQTVIKLTAPGVPDIYQGSELWNLNMMDPDNRRPVDFGRGRQMLLQQSESSARCRRLTAEFAAWHDGAIKLDVLTALLHFRREHPGLFMEGQYQALSAEGQYADHVLAYLRQSESERLVVMCSRFPAARENAGAWADTSVPLAGHEPEWRDLLTDQRVPRKLDAETVFRVLPVAVLVPSAIQPRA